MTDKPIMFSGPMVRAILDGSKTQTRRVLKLNGHRCFTEFCPSTTRGYDWCFRDTSKRWHDITNDELFSRYLPYKVGDRLWVRETWRVGAWDYDSACNPHRFAIDYIADNYARTEWLYPKDLEASNRLVSQSLDEIGVGDLVWSPGDSPLRARPSIFMPRWASRLTLTVTDVRVQRVQDIIMVDAIAEGIMQAETEDGDIMYSGSYWEYPIPYEYMHHYPEDAFRDLWDSINAKKADAKAWRDNPWVVALTFAVEQRNIDEVAA
tara:strand:+ start:172 stop:963 length:792 start_codon:yes stop_codon:yes gene_type:complete